MRNILLLTLLFTSIIGKAQIDTNNKERPISNSQQPIITLDEQLPEFEGGEQARINFINQNLIYPKPAIDNNIEGIVKLRFIVKPTGEIGDIIVLIDKKKIGFGLEEAAIAVVKKMPKWISGKHNGINVPLSIDLPIKFNLSSIKTYSEKAPNNVYLIGTEKPQFPGGKTAMNEFINSVLNYPKEALEHKIEGKVTLKFIIDSIGKICCIDILGEPIGYGLEQEAIRILKAMPAWIPANLDNKPVAIYYRIPIMFKYYEE